MKAGFYPRLAVSSIRKNARLYIPYWITCQLCVCVFYLLTALSENPVIRSRPGGGSTQLILTLGSIVLGFFSVIFLFYTYAFLLRRRRQEFGLYTVLGMDRRAISRVLLWETLITAGITMGIGLIVGIVVSKLGEMMLLRMVGAAAQQGFQISLTGICGSLLLFGAVNLLLYLHSLRKVCFSTVTDLLHSTQTGEKPPKARIPLAILGLVLLAAAYWMAVSIKTPLTALLLFFAAVILVIIATYLLMITGSVTLCRVLQRNKRFYYQNRHYISVSSMAFRMKRNGAGLASICILATMVLVILSSTTCLYFGADSSLTAMYPREMNLTVTMYSTPEGISNLQNVMDGFTDAIHSVCTPKGQIINRRSACLSGLLQDGHVILDPGQFEANTLLSYDNVGTFCFLDMEESGLSMDVPTESGQNTLLVYSPRLPVAEGPLTIGDTEFQVKTTPAGFTYHTSDDDGAIPVVYLFTTDMESTVTPFCDMKDRYNASILTVQWTCCFDIGGTMEEQLQVRNQILEQTGTDERCALSFSSLACREAQKADFYWSFGGFFFLGILLSIVFLAATAIIIYYKQITEGFEDQSRFSILRKVGMTTDDIRASINSQMKTVFFFPLGMAVLHLCFAFPMIRKLLMLFSLNDLPLLLTTAGISVACFALFYVIVYRVTSGVYYRLVTFGDQRRA